MTFTLEQLAGNVMLTWPGEAGRLAETRYRPLIHALEMA